MIIAEAREKCKSLLARAPRDAVIVAGIALASSASFGLGFLAGQDAGQGRTAVTLETSPIATSPADGAATADRSIVGQVVASRNGTKYYSPDCAGASRISDANRVWFASSAAAQAAGYEPAANCKGI